MDTKEISDLLRIPCKVGDTVLCITGIDRDISKIMIIENDYIICSNHKIYFKKNFIGIDPIIDKYPQYLI